MNETDQLITETLDRIWSRSASLTRFQLNNILDDAIYRAKAQGIASIAMRLEDVVNSELAKCVEEEQI
jgi:hypothetical protein